MAMPVSLEVERIINLVRGFGWEKIKEEIVDDRLIVTIQKKVEVKPEPRPT